MTADAAKDQVTKPRGRQATGGSGGASPRAGKVRVAVVAVNGLHLKVEALQSKSDGSPTVEGRQAASS